MGYAMFDLTDVHDPLPDCDCRACAIASRDKLRVQFHAAEHFAMSKYASTADRNAAMLDEIDRLQATVAGLRKSAALRVQFHAAELADVTAERDMWKNTLAQRDRELAGARAIDIHSCHDGCTRAGCVTAGLREEVAGLQKTVEYFRAGQEQRAPKWVPSRVRLDGPVRGDYPIGHTTIAHEGERECKSNRYGAVSVLAENGQWLGVKPCEFEVVEWRENTPAARKAAP